MYDVDVAAVHLQILEAARVLANATEDGTFEVADLIRVLSYLNAGTVRTHVASRCCVNAPAHHQSRYPYFRALGAGRYRVEPPFRRRGRNRKPDADWQARVIAALPSSVDDTLLRESLSMTPTERLETMRRAAVSLEAMTRG